MTPPGEINNNTPRRTGKRDEKAHVSTEKVYFSRLVIAPPLRVGDPLRIRTPHDGDRPSIRPAPLRIPKRLHSLESGQMRVPPDVLIGLKQALWGPLPRPTGFATFSLAEEARMDNSHL
jgi:hypothetical protein